jgi:arylsulfatase A-like enzyme
MIESKPRRSFCPVSLFPIPFFIALGISFPVANSQGIIPELCLPEKARSGLSPKAMKFGKPVLSEIQPKPLNVILIMADDLGYSDLGAYGGEIRTPQIDQLAREGLRFTGFTNTGRCCPSRASLVTGHYSHNVGMGWMTAADEHRPGYRGQIASDIPTIAEIFRDAGYRTYMSGKWHLTADGNIMVGPGETMQPNGSWPTERGFDEYFGHLSGGGPYDRPRTLARNETHIRVEDIPEGFYYTTAITEHAVKFIQEHDSKDPFFLYVAHYAPHRPLDAPEDRIAPYREVYSVGYDILRQERFDRMESMALIPPGHELPLHEIDYDGERPSWDSLTTEQKAAWVEEMATYAAMVEIMDDGVGEVVEALKELGMYENTLIFYFSDNGATMEGGDISRLAASLSNTPYRTFKQFSHAGGVNSPFIVRFNGIEVSRRGSIVEQRSHVMDILPTVLEAAGIPYPETFQGKTLPAIDGLSLWPSVHGNPVGEGRDLFFEHQTSSAVLSGDWKLARLSSDHSWELFNLRSDPFEDRDLARALPEMVAELESKWNTWAENNHVLPLEPLPWRERVRYYHERFPNQSGR